MRLRRVVFLLEILKRRTNNTNKLTINELIERLKNEGYNVTRNTVKSDINSLIDANKVTDAHINSLIDAKLGVIENGSY